MTIASKFKVGDKVVAVKDTPQTPEGWVGFITNASPATNLFDYYVQERTGEEEIAFYEHELELLGAGKVVFDEYGELNIVETPKVEYTGGSSNYYKVFVNNPTTLNAPYEAECNDIIEALKMTFAEGNAFKAIWRKAKARQGVQKKGYDNGLYDSEKVVFFGERMVVEAKSETE